LVGPAEYGINITSGGGNKVTDNIVIAADFLETGNYDGIKVTGSNNLIESNHIRAGGKVGIGSAINVVSATNILGSNWIDSSFSTQFGGIQPNFQINSSGVGVGIDPDTELHLAGNEFKITSPDVIKANPIRLSTEFSRASDDVFPGAEFRVVVISSISGEEASDARMAVNNRTSVEDRLIAFYDGGLGLQSPDGTWYKLQPPNGGGTISWVATPYTP